MALFFESFLSIFQYLNQGSLNGLFYFFGERAFNSQTPGIANASINGELALRPYATFSHPNVLSGFLVISMLYLLLFYKKNKYGIFFLFSGIVLGSIALLLSLSTVSILLWIITLVLLFGSPIFEKYKKNKISKKIAVMFLVAVIIVFSAGLFFVSPHVFERVISTRASEESVVQREELVNSSLEMFYKNPVLGVGINNFYGNLNFSKFSNKPLLIQPVHNIYLLVLSETGLIGLAFFVYMFLFTFRFLFKKGLKKTRYLFYILLIVVIIGMFDHYFLTLQQGQLLLSISFGFMLAKSA